jgi:prepilin-type N-terminal cleavage/methylation domain-containing protein
VVSASNSVWAIDARRSMEPLKMNRRRGFTLIEMLVVIAVSGALMAVAVGLLHTMIRLEHGSREELRERTAMMRLADQFRRDVHAATQFTPPGEGHPGGQRGEQPNQQEQAGGASRTWQLSLGPDRVVEYQAEPGAIARTERASGDVLSRESYAIAPATAVSIGLAGEEAPGIVTLRIELESGQPPAPGVCPFRVDAELAKDGRFLKP